MLGHYPTAAHRLDALSRAGAELWIKRDDLTSKLYGGNKVRKLELIFAAAAARGARRLFTAGAAGSHHVLATTIYGRRAGFDVAALLIA
jgi:D-cysteine desulfhydrase